MRGLFLLAEYADSPNNILMCAGDNYKYYDVYT